MWTGRKLFIEEAAKWLKSDKNSSKPKLTRSCPGMKTMKMNNLMTGFKMKSTGTFSLKAETESSVKSLDNS